MNLNQSLNSLFDPRDKRVAVWFLTVSSLGFLDALYLAITHYLGTNLNCFILKGCDVVTTSYYATLLGVPVALLGTIYYLFILLLSIVALDIESKRVLYIVARIVPLGFLASLWFIFAQVFLIKSLCIYCIFSAITSTALFIIGFIYLRKNNH